MIAQGHNQKMDEKLTKNGLSFQDFDERRQIPFFVHFLVMPFHAW